MRLLLLLLLLPLTASATTVYRCVDAKGTVVYSDRQCARGAQPKDVKTPPKAGLDQLGKVPPKPAATPKPRAKPHIPTPPPPAEKTRPAKRGPY